MAETGRITDEGVARLRARIGVPEPHPMPPLYTVPTYDTFRNVAVAYGDDNPLWCDPEYGAKTRWEGAIAPPALVGGDTLIGEDEVTEVAAEHRDLMKGDPLRGVHAFYAASAREWWAPLYPLRRVHPAQRARRRRSTSRASSRAGRSTSGPRRCSATTSGALLVGPVPADGAHRTREGARAQEVRRRRARAPTPTSEIDEIEAQYDRERARGAEPRWWEDVEEGDEVGPMVKGPLTVTDMICWHSGHGHGSLRREAAAARLPEPQAHPALLPPRRPQRPRRHATRALGPRVRASVRQPDHLRLRPHARDVAHPPLHRLDGRRRVAVEARLRVPRVQLRRRHAVAARQRHAQVPGAG